MPLELRPRPLRRGIRHADQLLSRPAYHPHRGGWQHAARFYSCEDGGALPSILVEDLADEVFAALSRVTGLPAEAMADPLSILDVLHHVLADGEIAVVVEAGHEKARTVTGQAWAIHASGARIDINAEREVVSRARAAWGQKPSPAHY